MNQTHLSNEHGHSHGGSRVSALKRLHRDWRIWVMVGIMLAAMFAYILSQDDSLQPEGPPPAPPSAATAGQ